MKGAYFRFKHSYLPCKIDYTQKKGKKKVFFIHFAVEEKKLIKSLRQTESLCASMQREKNSPTN